MLHSKQNAQKWQNEPSRGQAVELYALAVELYALKAHRALYGGD